MWLFWTGQTNISVFLGNRRTRLPVQRAASRSFKKNTKNPVANYLSFLKPTPSDDSELESRMLWASSWWSLLAGYEKKKKNPNIYTNVFWESELLCEKAPGHSCLYPRGSKTLKSQSSPYAHNLHIPHSLSPAHTKKLFHTLSSPASQLWFLQCWL